METTENKVQTNPLDKRFKAMMREAEIAMQAHGVSPGIAIFTFRASEQSPFRTYVTTSEKLGDDLKERVNVIKEELEALVNPITEQSNTHNRKSLHYESIISGHTRVYFSGFNNPVKKLEYQLFEVLGFDLDYARWFGIPFGKQDFIEGFMFLVLEERISIDIFREIYTNINKPLASGFYFDIPNHDEFGDQLQDKLHSLFRYKMEWSSKVMLVCNLYNRNKDRKYKHEESLVYAGTDAQRRWLEKSKPNYYIKNVNHSKKARKHLNGSATIFKPSPIWTKVHEEAGWYSKQFDESDGLDHKIDRNYNWKKLTNKILSSTDRQVETYQSFKDFQEGRMSLNDIKEKKLATYFEELSNKVQRHEFAIFIEHFDLSSDYYVGIPLLGLGTFQGIIWIVFKEEEKYRFDKEGKFLKRIIREFQTAYDDLILAWDLVGQNISIQAVTERLLYYIKNEPSYFENNPILQECGVKEYYQDALPFIEKRISQNNIVPQRFVDNHRSTATITTLIDSFAHNISAHTLITLVNWYRELSEYVYGQPENQEKLGRGNNPLINYINLVKDQRNKGFSALSLELHRFFKFLLEKGAFWSGITRRTNFAGKISSFFNVFWYDFINNALYLGTIANSEKVNKININFTIYEEETKQAGDDFLNVKIIKKNKDGDLLSGQFAIIDMNDVDIDRNMNMVKEKSYSQFVRKGKDFEKLSEILKELKVFFPGGIVGKHAFFTLIENEIRNIKHYKSDHIMKDMRENGLQLYISLHLRPVDSEDVETGNTSKKELVKIGVWLNHAIPLKSSQITERIEELKGDVVINESFLPRLGGSVQDKNCASQLLNNNFSMVMDNTSPKGRIYYPWIKIATATAGQTSKGEITEFEVSLRKYNQYAINQFQDIFQRNQGEKEGYLKKYFHLWKGEEVFFANEDTDLRMEEPSRFQFVQVETAQRKLLEQRLKGLRNIIRVIDYNASITNSEEAYPHWLPIWMKGLREYCLDFSYDGDLIGRLLYQNEQLNFYNNEQLEQEGDHTKICEEKWKEEGQYTKINLMHGYTPTDNPQYFNYRSHGRLFNHYWKNSSHIAKLEMLSTTSTYELFEALFSRVAIFDNRIYNRVCNINNKKEVLNFQREKLKLFRKDLKLDFNAELFEHWEALKARGLMKNHFIIIHLSFVEGMVSPKTGKKYTENGIKAFIDEQILEPMGLGVDDIPEHFNLIITTGRGRRQWWEIIKNTPYARFTSFRQIEAINSAVGDAIEIADDIDVKIGLVKLLLGS